MSGINRDALVVHQPGQHTGANFEFEFGYSQSGPSAGCSNHVATHVATNHSAAPHGCSQYVVIGTEARQYRVTCGY